MSSISLTTSPGSPTTKVVLDTSMSPSINKRRMLSVSDDNILQDRMYLRCPYEEKDECKSAGGKWDPEVKKWYSPYDIYAFSRESFVKWLPPHGPKIKSPSSVSGPPSISKRGAKKPMETNIASVHSEDLEVCINESVIPFFKKETYVRRISSKNLKLTENYKNMKSVFEVSGIGCWLVEKKRGKRVKDGDHMGFITGDSKDAIVEMFRVVGVEERPVYDEENPKGFWEEIMNWESETETLIISLVSVGDVEEGRVSWNEWKRVVNYNENYMPRGIRKVISPL